jgi:hypothetical protein
MEEACITNNPEWNSRNRLWGHFDILNIYAALGNTWQPFVSNGKLNLELRINPKQWLEGLDFKPTALRDLKYIDWVVPADLSEDYSGYFALDLPDEKEKLKFCKAPPLSLILFSLIQRINRLLYEPTRSLIKIEDVLKAADEKAFLNAFQQSIQANITDNKFKEVPHSWPGKFYGLQKYSSISRAITPYLNIASILHVGKYTHFGCGTFEMR